jgi:hypothetical protein
MSRNTTTNNPTRNIKDLIGRYIAVRSNIGEEILIPAREPHTVINIGKTTKPPLALRNSE